MQDTRHKYQDTSRKIQVSRRETRETSLMSKSLVSKSLISNTPSLCNIPVAPNKKGDRCHYSHHPRVLCIDPHLLQTLRDQVGGIILAILILITKTLQMYVFF